MQRHEFLQAAAAVAGAAAGDVPDTDITAQQNRLLAVDLLEQAHATREAQSGDS